MSIEHASKHQLPCRDGGFQGIGQEIGEVIVSNPLYPGRIVGVDKKGDPKIGQLRKKRLESLFIQSAAVYIRTCNHASEAQFFNRIAEFLRSQIGILQGNASQSNKMVRMVLDGFCRMLVHHARQLRCRLRLRPVKKHRLRRLKDPYIHSSSFEVGQIFIHVAHLAVPFAAFFPVDLL